MSHHRKLGHYLYICKDILGNIFAVYGDSYFPMSKNPRKHWKYTPFGYISNISSDVKVPNNYKVLWQFKTV